MTTKNYEKKCARLVQEATKVPYMKALNWVREHQQVHPESMPAETRALGIVDCKDVK